MTNEINEMLLTYGLTGEESILPMLEGLRTYPDLKKETWHIGMEGGDYIYSFDSNYIFITDDIWNFNLIARQPVLELLVKGMNRLRALDRNQWL